MTRHRVFIASPVPEEAQIALGAAAAPLREEQSPRLRWLQPCGWHLTLKFVGDVDAAMLPALARIAAHASQAFPMNLIFNRIELFPHSSRPLVLAATGSTPEALLKSAADIDRQTTALGIAPERRPFRSHVSLARIRGRRPLSLPTLACDVAVRFSSCVLMESIPTSSGRRYQPVAEPLTHGSQTGRIEPFENHNERSV